MNYTIQDFTQGMDARWEPSKIPGGAYALLFNGRVRDNVVQPFLKPALVDAQQPIGKHQGLYAAQQYALLFIAGKAYLKDFRDDSSYREVGNVQLNADVERIFAELVPASTINFKRVSSDGNASSDVNLTTPVGASPQAIVCQDGITQPQLILSDGSGRAAGNYNDWTPDNREYVPVGKQMLFDGTILYIISGNRILRSVSGRPVDFMIPITTTGDKLPEESGNADAVSHAVSYDNIVAIHSIASDSTQFMVSTGKASWFVVPDFTELFFGEPKRFTNIPLFPTGPINQFAKSSALGDEIFVDLRGVRSFNAVAQTRNEGKNTPFSLKLQRVLGDRKQQDAVVGRTDDYVFIAVDTIYGPAVIVYDETTGQFVSIDIYEDVASIKQFAEYQVDQVRKLLFITSDDKHYEFGAGSTYETCKVYAGDFIAGINRTHKLARVHCVFTDVKTSGIVYATQYVDGKAGNRTSKFIKQDTIEDEYPVEPPFEAPNKSKLFTATFSFSDESLTGVKIGVFIEWAFNAKLAFIQIETDDKGENVNQNERAQQYAAAIAGAPSVTTFSPAQGGETVVVNFSGRGLSIVEAVYLGSLACNIVSQTPTELKVTVPIGAVSGYFTLSYESGSLTISTTFEVV